MHILLLSLAVVQILLSGSQCKPQVAQNEVSGSESCRDISPSCSVWGHQCGSSTDARYRDEWCRKTCGTCTPKLPSRSTEECPSPWFHIADQCFLLVNDKSDWSSARTQCGTLAPGADLAQPRELNVLNDLVKYTFENGFLDKIYEGYWVGGSDLNAEGEWIWNNGSPIPTTGNSSAWGPGEPNDHHDGEDCIEMLHALHSTISLNDKDCERSLPFICERP